MLELGPPLRYRKPSGAKQTQVYPNETIVDFNDSMHDILQKKCSPHLLYHGRFQCRSPET